MQTPHLRKSSKKKKKKEFTNAVLSNSVKLNLPNNKWIMTDGLKRLHADLTAFNHQLFGLTHSTFFHHIL